MSNLLYALIYIISCGAPEMYGWNCTVCNGTFTAGFHTTVVSLSDKWDTLGFAGMYQHFLSSYFKTF